MVSEIVFEKMATDLCTTHPLAVHFPDYSKGGNTHTHTHTHTHTPLLAPPYFLCPFSSPSFPPPPPPSFLSPLLFLSLLPIPFLSSSFCLPPPLPPAPSFPPCPLLFLSLPPTPFLAPSFYMPPFSSPCLLLLSLVPPFLLSPPPPLLSLPPLPLLAPFPPLLAPPPPSVPTYETLVIMEMDLKSFGTRPRPFCLTYVNHIWNVFHNVCRDLSELRHLVCGMGCGE